MNLNSFVVKPCYYIVRLVFQGLSIPALNGVLSAWSLKNEKSRMVTLTYCGKFSLDSKLKNSYLVNLK